MEFAYTSAKAKCAACGKAVPMRGLAVGRDGGDGLTRWLHLQCAAPDLPENFAELPGFDALQQHDQEAVVAAHQNGGSSCIRIAESVPSVPLAAAGLEGLEALGVKVYDSNQLESTIIEHMESRGSHVEPEPGEIVEAAAAPSAAPPAPPPPPEPERPCIADMSDMCCIGCWRAPPPHQPLPP